MTRPLILVTNDDGIESPGLAAAAAALAPLGDLLIVAPSEQQTSMSRSRTQAHGFDGRMYGREVRYGDRSWEAAAVNATPALTVEHAVQELAPRLPDLCVSGINYGENVGTCVTVSGTIGAALEAAERRIPALAVSLEVDPSLHYAHDLTSLDFSASIAFVRRAAAAILSATLPHDVDLFKLEVPASATSETPLVVVRQDRFSYYTPQVERTGDPFTGTAKVSHHMARGQYGEENTDTHALAQGWVSLTPLSLDLTSRVDLKDLETLLNMTEQEEDTQ